MIGNQLRKLAGVFVAVALTQLPLAAAPNGISYKIHKGDTLWSLASKYHTSVDKIAQTNGIDEDAKLRIGKVIRIPSVKGEDKSVDSAISARQAQLSLNLDRAKLQESADQKDLNASGDANSPQADTLERSKAAADDDDQDAQGNSNLIRSALSCRGLAYRSGGTSRGGFDCSGFTRYIFAKYGVALPHSSAAQATKGKPITKSELKAGDLVFFHTYRAGVSHVGIYIGSGQFVHAARYGRGVTVDNLDSTYYRRRYVGARRMK